jgi:predicted acetyltransferase
MEFVFKDFPLLTDGVIDLLIEQRNPAYPPKAYAPSYHLDIVLHRSKAKVGKLRLRLGTVDEYPKLLTSGHIGYEVDEPNRGHGFAARACLLSKKIALAHGFNKLIITCNPDNVASRKTCERVGATLSGIFDVPKDHEMYQKGRRKVCRYEWAIEDTPAVARFP